MRILIGSNVHWWNAEAAYASKIAQLLLQAGHKVFVLTRPDSLNSQKLGSLGLSLVEHINLNSNNPFQLFLSYQKLKKFIDLAHAHEKEKLYRDQLELSKEQLSLAEKKFNQSLIEKTA
ncbi:MAG: hypothetical protein QF779_06100, partial [SAR324 cluster bacterium]|nr:hypothetical protein [SAR324 cluster bacterium]